LGQNSDDGEKLDEIPGAVMWHEVATRMGMAGAGLGHALRRFFPNAGSFVRTRKADADGPEDRILTNAPTVWFRFRRVGESISFDYRQVAWTGSWHGRERDVLVEGGETALIFHGEGEQVEVGDLL
jgi:hypothetical protein